MLSMYPACFFNENDGYSVVFPDLNWLATQGDTFEEAMEMAVECLAGYLHTCQMDGDTVPKPSKLSDIHPEEVAKELDPEAPLGESFVNMVSVDVALYAKEHFEKSVKKTLTIPAWLNKAALEQNINFSLVLINGKTIETYITKSVNFRKKEERKIAFDVYYDLNKQKNEEPLAFAIRMG